MAKKEKESIVTKILGFVTDKKKLPLLLLLLGGGATVVTGTVLLANPGNGGNSTTSQTSGGSVAPFSGNEVPNWDFDNATIDGDATTVGVGYDFSNFGRFQNEYFYQSGRNYYEGAPVVQNDYYTELAFSIYNMRTTEVEFLYHFELSQDRRDWEIENEYDRDYNYIRIGYDQQDTILLIMEYHYPELGEPNYGGAYTTLENYIDQNFNPNPNQFITLILKFDINNQSEYTVLDAYLSGGVYQVYDILFEDNRLFLSTSFSKSIIDNPNSLTDDLKLDFTSVPSTYPSFTNTLYPNPSFSFLTELNFDDFNAMTTISNDPITFDHNGNLWFYGYRVGFETKYMNDNGDLALGVNSYLYLYNDQTISEFFDGLEDNFIAEEDRTEVYNELETTILRFDERVREYNANYDPNFNIQVSGFYNFTTKTLNAPNYGGSSWQSVTIDNQQYQLNNYFYSTVMVMDDNITAFLIVTENFALYPINSGIGGWSNFNPEYNLYTRSTLSSLDLETGATTVIEDNEFNGKVINGIYQKEGGYYVTGTFYEAEGGREGVQSTDAFLIELDEAFAEVDTLVLSGSGDDAGNQITLNSQGRPVWLVNSNSTDGDFAAAATSNTTGAYKIYSVTF